MAGTRKGCPPEFELAAVKMIAEQKLPVAEVARRLGVTENRLHDWKKAPATEGVDAFPGSGHPTPLEEESRAFVFAGDYGYGTHGPVLPPPTWAG